MDDEEGEINGQDLKLSPSMDGHGEDQDNNEENNEDGSRHVIV